MAEKEITLSDVEEEMITKAFARNTQYFIFFPGSALFLSFQSEQLSAGRLLGPEKITSYLIISKVQSKLKICPTLLAPHHWQLSLSN